MKRKILACLLIFCLVFTQNGAALATGLGQAENSGAAQARAAIPDEATSGDEAVENEEEVNEGTEESTTPEPVEETQENGDSSVQNLDLSETLEPVKIIDPALVVDNPMAITQAPQNVDVKEGDTVTFSAAATAEKPEELTYQWQKTTERGITATPQSTDEALQQKQAALQSLETGALLTGEEEKVLSEEEKQAQVQEIKAAPIEVDNTGWQDVPGATGTSLTVTVDHTAATRATSYRMVAKTAGVSLATPAAALRSSSLFAGGSGTEDDPYLIGNFDQLNNIKGNLFESFYYRLTCDIDATGREWMPIGGSTILPPFKGGLDGNGFVIKNLTITHDMSIATNYRPTPIFSFFWGSAYGLFGATENAVIKNLGLENMTCTLDKADFSKSEHIEHIIVAIGGIAASGKKTTIENCFVTGSIDLDASIDISGSEQDISVGGITGCFLSPYRGDRSVTFDDSYIKNCYSSISINSNNAKYLTTGSIYPVSELGRQKRKELGKYYIEEKRPTTVHSYYNTTANEGSGDGTGMPQSSFTDNTVLNALNEYVESEDYSLNKWTRDANGFPNLVHKEPINITVRDYMKTWNGSAQQPTFTTDQPAARQGEDWWCTYTKDGSQVDSPTEVGTYTMRFENNPASRRLYSLQRVISEPEVSGLEPKTAQLVINPNEDANAPEITNIRYTNLNNSDYNPGEWNRDPVKVSFDIKEAVTGSTREVLCGPTAFIVDEKQSVVSGLNPDSVSVTDPYGHTHTAQREGDTYSVILSATEAESFNGPLTLRAADNKGNETTVNTGDVRISLTDIKLSARAFVDGDTTGAELASDLPANTYSFFGRNKVSFDLSAETVLPNGSSDNTTVTQLEYQLVPDGSSVAENGWTSQDFDQSQKTASVSLDAQAPYNGRLYVRATCNTGVVKEASYHFMLDKNAPVITQTAETTGYRYSEDNSGEEPAETYVRGDYYSSVEFVLKLDDYESGIADVKAARADNGAALPVTHTQNPADTSAAGQLGQKTDTISIKCDQQGSYKARITVTDKAGNESSFDTESVNIDQETPEVQAEWKTPAGKSTDINGGNYGFGVWSDKKAGISLSNTNTAVKSDIVYYYRTAPEGTADWSEWTAVNPRPLSPAQSVTLTSNTEGSCQYQFKAETAAGKTSGIKADLVKIDTQAPDTVAMTPDSEANENGWFNKNITLTLSFKDVQDVSPQTAEYETWWKPMDDGSADPGQKIDGSKITVEGAIIDWPSLCGGMDDANSASVHFNRDGVYTVKAIAIDSVGRETVTTRVFKMDVTRPMSPEVTFNGYTFGNIMSFISFGAFGRPGDTVTIAVEDKCSGSGNIEYQIVEDGQPSDGVWHPYDPQNKPIISRSFDGHINVRAWDKAGNLLTTREGGGDYYETNTFKSENKKPELNMTADKDTTAWQQEMTFEVKAQDSNSGIQKIEILDSTDAGLKTMETYTIPYDQYKEPGNQADLRYMGSQPVEGQIINAATLPYGTAGARDNTTGLLTGEVIFNVTRKTPAINRSTPNVLQVVVTDNSGNQTSQTVSYKIDNAAPMVKAEKTDGSAWQKDETTINLSLTNEAPEDQSVLERANTLSAVRYYYRAGDASANAAAAELGWKPINEVPIYGIQNYVYDDNFNGNIYFRAVSQSGMDSGNPADDYHAFVNVKIDKVNPQNVVVAVNNQTDGADAPDGSHSWYKTLPQLAFTTPAEDEDGGLRSSVNTWYQLSRDGEEGEATPLGAAISGKYVSGDKGIGNNLNTTDRTAKVDSVAAIDVQSPGADANTGADGSVGASAIPSAVGAPENIGADAAVAQFTEKDCALGGILEPDRTIPVNICPDTVSEAEWKKSDWTMVGDWNGFVAALNNNSIKKIRLTADIDLSTHTGTGLAIAADKIIDGQGYRLTGVNRTSGVFAENKGTISNLILAAPKIEVTTSGMDLPIGGLVNKNGGTLYNCHVLKEYGGDTGEYRINTTVDWASYLGTLAGVEDHGAGIFFCTSNLSIMDDAPTLKKQYIGGILGGSLYNDSRLNNCAYTGTINMNNCNRIGGIAGSIGGSASDPFSGLYSEVTIKGDNNQGCGGIIGALNGWYSAVKDCRVSTASIEGAYNSGGIVGLGPGIIENCLVEDTIIKCIGNTCGGIGGHPSKIKSCTVKKSQILGSDTSQKIGGLVGEVTYAYGSLEQGLESNLVEDTEIKGRLYIGGLGGSIGVSYGQINDYKITKCRVSGLTIGGQGYSGGLIGNFAPLQKGEFENCTVDNLKLDGKNGSSSAGLIGNGSKAMVQNCKFTGDNSVTGGSFTGGIIGTAANSSITQCEIEGTFTIIAQGHSNGGAVGSFNDGAITDNKLSGITVTGKNNTGGFIGDLQLGAVHNNEVNGVVNGTGNVGGFVGWLSGNGTLDHNTANTAVTATGTRSGGFAGGIEKGTFTANLAKGAVNGGYYTGGFAGSISNIALSNNRAEGNVTGTTAVGGFAGQLSGATLTKATAKGSVTATGNNAGGLAGELAGTVNRISDALVDQTAVNTSAVHTISNSKAAAGTIEATNDNAGGLVGLANSAVRMTNCTAAPASITGRNNLGGAVGSVADSGARSALTAILINNPSRITGGQNLGGLVGSASNVDVSRCDTSASVTATGSSAGGAVGTAGNALFSTCNARGAVKGEDNTGGFAGVSNATRYENCAALGNAEGSSNVGGFIGRLNSDMITNSGAGGTVSGATNVGGFAGQNYDTGGAMTPTVPGDGQYILKYWTQDEAGNTSQKGIRSFKVDTTPPDAPAIDVDGTVYSGVKTGTADTSLVIKDSAPVTLKAQDAGSGLDYMEYGAQSGNAYDSAKVSLKTVNGDAFSFSINPAFTGYVYAKATDNAGNTAESYSSGFQLETTKYITTAAPVYTPAMVNGWTTGSVSFTLGCTQGDGTAATATSYQYSKDGGAWQAVTGSSLTLSAENQSGAYYFRAVINGVAQDNILETEAVPVQLDTEAPTVSLKALPATAYESRDNIPIYTDTVEFKASASDTASGVASLEYQLGSDAAWHACDGLIAVPAGFDGTVKVRATDKAGKTSAIAETARFMVNSSAPAQPVISASDSYDLAAGSWTGNALTLKAAAPSGDNSIKTIEYQKADGSWAAMPAEGITYNTSGIHTLTCRSAGYNGVVSVSVSAVVRINKDVPDINVQVYGQAAAKDETPSWTNEAVRFDVTTENGVSLWNDAVEIGSTSKHEVVRAAADGKHSFSFTSKNNVDTVSTPAAYTVWLDQTAPAAPSIETDGTPDAGGWYQDDLKLTITAALNPESDTASAETAWYRVYKQGVAAGAYAQTNAGGELPALTDDGIYTVEAYTADAAGNQSGVVSRTIKKTSEAKEGELVPAITLTGELALDTPEKIYKSGVTAELTAVSTGNALACLEYQWVDTESVLASDGWMRYSEANKPVFENMAGTIYARAVDAAGKTTAAGSYASEAFISDTREPSVEVEAPEGVAEKAWTQGPVTLALKGGNQTKDGKPVLSGFDHYEISTDDGASWQTVGNVKDAGSYTVNVTGKHSIQARSVSKAGIAGDSAAYALWIDNAGQPGGSEALEIALDTAKTGGDTANGWYSKIVYTPKLADGSNIPSGVSFYYSMDKITWTGLAALSLTVDQKTPEAGTTYYFKGVSGAGAESGIVEDTAKIDTVEPAEPGISNPAKDSWQTSPLDAGTLENLVTVPDTDRKNKDKDGENRSAVTPQLKIEKDGDTTPVKDFDDDLTLVHPLTTGTYKLTGRSEDSAGNISDYTGIQTVKVDTDAPVVGSIAFKKINDSSAAKLMRSVTFDHFFNETVKVEIVAEDIGSGVRSIAYEVIDNDTDAVLQEETKTADKNGSVSFTLPPKSNVRVQAAAVDAAGLRSAPKTSGNAIIEAEKPEIMVTLKQEPAQSGWYNADVPFTVDVEDADSGLKAVTVYVNSTGLVEGTPVFEKQDYTQADKSIKAENLTAAMEGSGCIVVKAVDQAGNEQTTTKSYKLEKGLDLTANMTVLQSSKTDPDNPDAPISQIPVAYNGAVTSYPVTVHLDIKDPVTGAEPLSGIEKIEYAKASSDGRSLEDWQRINGMAAQEHYVDEETDSDYVFRVTTFAGNTCTSAVQHIAISRSMPPAPQLRVTLDGSDVNGQWVNRVPEVGLYTPGCGDANIVSRTEYQYSTNYEGSTDNSRSGITAASGTDQTHNIPAVTDNGIYSIKAWAQDKEGAFIDTANMAKANVCFDDKPPVGVHFGYTRESTEKGTRVILLIGVEDETSGGKSVDYEYTNDHGQTVDGTGLCISGVTNSGSAALTLTDIMPGTTVKILKMTDNAGNDYTPAQPIESNTIDPDEMPGADVVFTETPAPNAGKWNNASTVTVNTAITVKGSSIYKPADDGSGSLMPVPDENSINSIDYYGADGRLNPAPEGSIGPDGKTAAFDITITPDQQGIFELPVTVYDTWRNTSTAACAVKHDSLAPKAPEVTLTVGGKPYTGDATGSAVVLAIQPDYEGESDSTSPFVSWQYSIDNGNSWSEPITIEADKPESLKTTFDSERKIADGQLVARVNDAAGNAGIASAPKALRMKDTTAPENLTLTEADGSPVDSGWQTTGKNRTLKVTAEEPSDGVVSDGLKDWQYSLDGGKTWKAAQPWKTGKDNIFAILEDGSYEVTFKVHDGADNETVYSESKTVRIDRAAPAVETSKVQYTDVKMNPLQELIHWLSFGNFYNDTVRVTIPAEDAVSGNKTLHYMIGDETKQKSISEKDKTAYFDMPVNTTKGKVSFRLEDRAGNTTQDFKLDGLEDSGNNEWRLENGQPVISEFGTAAEANPMGWYTGDVPYSIELSDTDSGIAGVTVTADGQDTALGSETFGNELVKQYTFEGVILNEGVQNIGITLTDNSGNTAEEQYTIKKDTQKPVLGDIRVTGESRVDGAYTSKVDYTIPAADTISGLKRLTLKINDCGPQVIECPDGTEAWDITGTLEKDSNYKLTVTAEDNAGLMTEAQYDLQIDQHEPELYPLSPKNGDKDVDTGTLLTLMANEPMVKGDGYITLYEAESGAIAAELHSSNNRVTISGNTISVQLPSPLKVNTGYYVVVGDGFLKDTGENPAKGIGGKDRWQFKTKADDSKVTILGFKAEHITRTADGVESSTEIAAVVDGQNPRSYNILTPADYIGDDGKASVKMVVTPLYNANPEDLTIKAVSKDGRDISDYVTRNADNTFTIQMPDTEEQADITISIGEGGSNQFHIIILNKNYQARINATDIEADASQDQLLNSIDLSEEANNPSITQVNVILNITREDAESVDETDRAQIEAAASDLKETLAGEAVEMLYLDINLLKQVTVVNETGENTSEEEIKNLQNPIVITVTIPEAFQGDYIYHIIREHNGQTDVLIPEVSGDGKCLSFETDRFSTYAITATRMPEKPTDPDDPAEPDTPADPENPAKPEEPVKPSTPTAPEQQNPADQPEYRVFTVTELGKTNTTASGSSIASSAAVAEGSTGTGGHPDDDRQKNTVANGKSDTTAADRNVYADQPGTAQNAGLCLTHFWILAVALILSIVFEFDIRRRQRRKEEKEEDGGGYND